MSAPEHGRTRVTVHLDLTDDGLVPIHAADALLHLITALRSDGIDADATLHVPGQGTLTTSTHDR